MGAVKVNSDEVWDEYVKTGKVKGFSIEGYFADKAERPKEAINDLEMEAEQQLSSIRSIIKEGETEIATHKVEIAGVDDINNLINDVEDTINLIAVYTTYVNDTKYLNKELSSQVTSQIQIKTSLQKKVDTADNKADKIY